MSRLSQSITQTSSRLWNAWSIHRQTIAAAKTQATQSPRATIEGSLRILPDVTEHATVGDVIKDFFVSQGSWILPFVIAGLLAVSSGYLFANFNDFSWSAPTYVKIAYIGGGCLEFGALIGVFSANRNLQRRNMRLFWIIFVGVVFFSVISALAQFAYLENTVTLNIRDVNHAPIFNWFVGFAGADGKEWLFFLRSITFHTLEIFCTFLFSLRERTVAQIAKAHKERMQAEMDAQRETAIMEVSARINEIVTSAIGDVGKMVDTTMTQALLNMRQGKMVKLPEGEEQDTGPLALSRLNGRKGKEK